MQAVYNLLLVHFQFMPVQTRLMFECGITLQFLVLECDSFHTFLFMLSEMIWTSCSILTAAANVLFPTVNDHVLTQIELLAKHFMTYWAM